MIFDILKNNWGLISTIVIVIVGFVTFYKDIVHIKNLHLQNRKLNNKSKTAYSERIEQFKKDYIIELSKDIKDKIKKKQVDIDEILFLIKEEFGNHSIFNRINYNSMPIPLKTGLFAFISKIDSKIVIEDVGSSIIMENWFDNWSELSSSYEMAYNLSFRSDHLKLINQSEFNRTRIKMEDLYTKLNAYYLSVIPSIGSDKIKQMHDLKGNISKALNSAINLYEHFVHTENSGNSNASEILGQVAIRFDVVISSIHKVLVDIKPNI